MSRAMYKYDFLVSITAIRVEKLSTNNRKFAACNAIETMKDVILAESLDGIGADEYKDYIAHALCMGGSCAFRFNDKDLRFSKGDLMIVRKGALIDNVACSDDFKVKTLYVATTFTSLCTPQSNYGTRSQFALLLNPVMSLTDEQRFVCERDFRWIEYRLSQTGHKFYNELLINAVQSAILDFFDFHSTLKAESTITTSNASIMNRFLSMLEDGTYRRHREVTYYADALCVTPKYLSEISKRVSGFSANYWINRYTSIEIARRLRDKSLTFAQISDMLGFSSPAYFSRYVHRTLGMNPTQYRE